MKYYFAPMEGITGRIYRNTFHEFFDKDNYIDKYFAPFIVYHEKCSLSDKDIKDVHPDNNKHIKLIPQVLTNKAHEYLELEKFLFDLGYDEININIGCPSKTVFSKKRGSGLLLYPDMLDEMLYGIFEKNKCRVSVKTRLGVSDPEEFYNILEIYNKYDISELIIHGRVQTQFYNGDVDMNMFYHAAANTKIPVCYNGNLFLPDDFSRIASYTDKYDNYADIECVMAGRGLIRRPSLIREINGGSKYTNDELMQFLSALRQEYQSEFSGEVPVLFKMKEIWSYMKDDFSEYPRELKKLFKAKSLAEYVSIERSILH